MNKHPETVEESLDREDKFFRSYTDKGVNPFEPYVPSVEDMRDEHEYQEELWGSGYYE